jgi:hypothetical protein
LIRWNPNAAKEYARQKVWHDLKRRVIGLHFNAAQAIGEYVEKAGGTAVPLSRAHARP